MEEIPLPEGDVMKKYKGKLEDQEYDILVNNSSIEIDGSVLEFKMSHGKLVFSSDDGTVEVDSIVRKSEGKYIIHIQGYSFDVEIHDPMHDLMVGVSVASGDVKSPMAGIITSIAVEVGQEVKEGDVLLVISAMKMENEILTPVSGVIKSLECSVNEQVNPDQLLITIKEN